MSSCHRVDFFSLCYPLLQRCLLTDLTLVAHSRSVDFLTRVIQCLNKRMHLISLSIRGRYLLSELLVKVSLCQGDFFSLFYSPVRSYLVPMSFLFSFLFS